MTRFDRMCAVGQSWPKLVAINTKLFGSGTARNRSLWSLTGVVTFCQVQWR